MEKSALQRKRDRVGAVIRVQLGEDALAAIPDGMLRAVP